MQWNLYGREAGQGDFSLSRGNVTKFAHPIMDYNYL